MQGIFVQKYDPTIEDSYVSLLQLFSRVFKWFLMLCICVHTYLFAEENGRDRRKELHARDSRHSWNRSSTCLGVGRRRKFSLFRRVLELLVVAPNWNSLLSVAHFFVLFFPKFTALRETYMLSGHAFLLVYSVVAPDSADDLIPYYEKILSTKQDYLDSDDVKPVVMVAANQVRTSLLW